jgi:hypothetical protein
MSIPFALQTPLIQLVIADIGLKVRPPSLQVSNSAPQKTQSANREAIYAFPSDLRRLPAIK